MAWMTSDVPREFSIDDLLIRCLRTSDAMQMVDAITESLPELRQWMPWARYEPQSATQRETFIQGWKEDWEAKRDFPFGIFRDGQLVGCIGLHLRHGEGKLEIGYWVRSSCVGQGIATKSSRALMKVAFTLPEIHEILIAHDIANIRSEAIPKKLGFSVLKEYESDINANSATGRNKLWSMKKEAWSCA